MNVNITKCLITVLLVGFSGILSCSGGVREWRTSIFASKALVSIQKGFSLEEVAQKTTVKVDGCRGQSGSGVIIKSREKKYYVLTARHVIGSRPGPEGNCQIKTNQSTKYEINRGNFDTLVRFDSELDLALIELVGDDGKIKTAAQLSPNLSEKQDVFVSGWRNCGKNDDEGKYQFSLGKTSKLLPSGGLSNSPEELYDPKIDYPQGYRVKYANPTMSGMSGGPVFDSKGRVVAVHGKSGHSKGLISTETCPEMNEELGNNWGIPISLFLDSNLAKDIDFETDGTPVKQDGPTARTTEIPREETDETSVKQDRPTARTTEASRKNEEIVPLFLCTEKGRSEGSCR